MKKDVGTLVLPDSRTLRSKVQAYLYNYVARSVLIGQLYRVCFRIVYHEVFQMINISHSMCLFHITYNSCHSNGVKMINFLNKRKGKMMLIWELCPPVDNSCPESLRV